MTIRNDRILNPHDCHFSNNHVFKASIQGLSSISKNASSPFSGPSQLYPYAFACESSHFPKAHAWDLHSEISELPILGFHIVDQDSSIGMVQIISFTDFPPGVLDKAFLPAFLGFSLKYTIIVLVISSP